MAATCIECGQTVTRYSTKFISDTAGKLTTRTECYACLHPTHTDLNVAKSIFHGEGLTLEHVTGDDGKPVRVTSLRQLHEAEKRYHFRSVIGHEDERNFDRRPDINRPTDPFEAMTSEKKWLYPEIAIPMLKEMRANGELIEQKQEKLFHNPHQR